MNMRHNQRSEAGIFLVDCLVYCGLLTILLGCAFMAFYKVMDDSRHLNQNAADIVRALNAGERWRKDVRSATGPPEIVEGTWGDVLSLPQANGKIQYAYHDGTVYRWNSGNTEERWLWSRKGDLVYSPYRRKSGNTDERWQVFLPDVKISRMEKAGYAHVTAWRWEIELATGKKPARVKPLFTFQAAAQFH